MHGCVIIKFADMHMIKTKRILITGASGGIGRTIALSLAEKGAQMALHYFSGSTAVKELQQELKCLGVESTTICADLSTKEGRNKMIATYDKLFDGCDILINNAGNSYAHVTNKDLDEEDVEKIMGLNFKAAFFLCQRYFPEMCKQCYGRIVNMSTISVKFGGNKRSLIYAASKSGIESLTKGLAKQGARHNVLVNAIRPGVIDTDFHQKNPKDMEKRIDMIPMRRMGRPEEVAVLVRFLVRDESSFITGGVYPVTGGE